MKHQLTTQSGRALYALRKQTVEPVFGIIKHVMGLRQFSLRGVDKVRGEWTLATDKKGAPESMIRALGLRSPRPPTKERLSLVRR